MLNYTSNNLEKIVKEALEQIKKEGITVAIGDEARAILSRRMIIVPPPSPTPLFYFQLRHEYYHLTYFPQNELVKTSILERIEEAVGAEFFEERLLVKKAFNFVSNAVVNRYGMEYDPHKTIYTEGHWQSIERQQLPCKYLKIYLELLDNVPVKKIDINRIIELVIGVYYELRE